MMTAVKSRAAARLFLTLAAICFSTLSPAQPLVITNGLQTFASLTNTTVILSNHCEVRLTAASSPLPGCLIHLNSPDAFFVLANVKPSVVVSTYLSQFRINGAVAVADSNCRVVQYGMGAIIVPHAASLQPLQVFSGPHFTGSATLLSQYVYYKGAGIAALNLSSFKLKRGYMVTFAQNENGSGLSKNYVAQDGDLEVSVLPGDFDNRVRFIYVTAWRWASKKGIAGNIESGLNVQWKYNWNNDQNSSRDTQYIPIRQHRWWPGLGSDWKARGADHLLGYNEPDRPDQANMSVGDAINSWGDLLATGLRVGAPAVSDGGRDWWLYPFLQQANAADLRVDFVPIHYYWCNSPSDPAGAANQMYNFLKETYDQVKRPLWVTEWNNGANWTGCGDPSYAQQAAAIAAMIDMLDNTPFVERYAPFNWVEDVRRLKWDDGSLTSAGVAYRDNSAPLAYLQALQDNGTRSFTELRFDGDPRDSSGHGNNGITTGTPAYTNGVAGQALVFDGANTKVTLPPNIAKNNAFTFAAWVHWNGGGNWQRIFDFGNSTTHYLYLTPQSGSGTMRFKIKNGGTEHQVDAPVLSVNQWRHVAVTLSGGTARIFLDGAVVASASGWTATPASFSPRVNFLGDSQFIGDPTFKGALDEVLIADYALTPAQIASLQTNTPPQFTVGSFSRPGPAEDVPYNESVAGMATDADPGDTLTYTKAAGPAWLNIAPDGTLSGQATSGDGGLNYFTVCVTDAAGRSDFAILTINVTVFSSSGTWAINADGNWSDTTRWSGGTVPSGAGQTADFSTLNITAPRTVTLNSGRYIGNLKFSDPLIGYYDWTITNTPGSTLTLDSGSGASPSIAVTNTAILAAPVAGTNGFTKSGPGTLMLSGENPLSGTVYVDTGSTSADDGIVRVTGPSALANATSISIRNNNSGRSTFQLDGSAGSISIYAQVSATYRNNTEITVQNLAGTNIFNGDLLLYEGGNSFTIQSDSGLVVFTGDLNYVGGLVGGRTDYFTGAGDHLVIGAILDATNGSPIAVVKSGAGQLTLEGQNTYKGTTTLSGGTLVVNGTLPAGALTISGGTALGGNGVIHAAVALPSGATLAPGASIGALTVANHVTLNAGSITRMEINQATSKNDQLQVAGLLTYGGTLAVTNLDGTLVAGDNFALFTAAGSVGNFASMDLPPLAPGLLWDFNPVTGILTVTSTNNTPPSISPIANLAINKNTSTDPLAFTIGDAETAASALVVNVASSNPGLVSAANIQLGGSGSNRIVTLTPLANQSGSAIITVAVSDGEMSTSTSFLLTVNAIARIAKADNTINLNQGTSWVDGVLPAAGDVAVWNNTVTAPNTVSLGGNLNWGGVSISNPVGPVTITAGNTLSLGASGIDLAGASQNLTINSGLTLDPVHQEWNVVSGRTLSVNGPVTRTTPGATLATIGGAGTVAFNPPLANGIVGPWASVNSSGAAAANSANGSTYATVTAGNVVPYTAATAANFGWTSSNPNTFNYDVTGPGGGGNQLGVNRTAHTARYVGGPATQYYGNNNTTTITLNGLMNAGTGALTFAQNGPQNTANSFGRMVIGANNELVLAAASAGITIAFPIIDGGAVGAVTVTGNGANAVSFNAANTYSGQTTVNGFLRLGGSGVVPDGSGKGNVVVNGTLDLNGFSETVNGLAGAGTVDTSSGGTPTLTVGGNNANSTFDGVIKNSAGTLALAKNGSGTFTLTSGNSYSGGTTIGTGGGASVVRATANQALGTGTISLDPYGNSTTARLELSGGISLPNAVYFSGRNNASIGIQSTDGNNALAGPISLAGGGLTYLIQSDSGSHLTLGAPGEIAITSTGAKTLTLQGAGDGDVAGNIDFGAGVSLTKSGGGTWTLSGNNTYADGTTVTQGRLMVNGSAGAGNVTVNSGATLGGHGIITGILTLQAGSTLAPGASIGRLTVNNDVVLAGTTLLEISKTAATNDQLRVTGLLNYGGTLTVTNLGGTLAAGDSFKLFDLSSYTGSFTTTNLPSLNSTNLYWAFDPANGTLTVLPTVALNPTNIVATQIGSSLQLEWPTEYIGWRVETNAVSVTDSNAWFTLEGSTLTNLIHLPISAATSNVFFRLVYP